MKLVHVNWYATVLRQDALAAELSLVAPLAMRYGAVKYAVHRSDDDRYKLILMVWFEHKRDWYRFWEGPEMVEFRRRSSGHYQIPVTYVWHEEIAAGELGPPVTLEAAPEPEPEPEPQVAS